MNEPQANSLQCMCNGNADLIVMYSDVFINTISKSPDPLLYNLKWKAISRVLCDKQILLKLKRKFYKSAIRSAMLYKAEC